MTSSVTILAEKGSPLSHTEVDNNFRVLRRLAESPEADSTGVSSANSQLSALNTAGTPIVMTPGTWRVSSNLTLTVPVTMQAGAKFTVDAGVTLTLNGAFSAADNQLCFIGDGVVKFGAKATSKVCLLWFNADPSNNAAAKAATLAAIKQWWNSVPTAAITSGSPHLYVNPGCYVTTHFGTAIAGFQTNAGIIMRGEGTTSRFKLAASENTRLFTWVHSSGGIRSVTFDGGNSAGNAFGDNYSNPTTTELVYLESWGCIYEDVQVFASGGIGLVTQGQQNTFIRPKIWYNTLDGMELRACYSVDVYSPWCEANGYTNVAATALVAGVTYKIRTVGTTNFTLVGASANTVGTVFTASGAGTGTGKVDNCQSGLVIRGANDGTNPRLIAYSGSNNRVFGGYSESTYIGCELRGTCNAQVHNWMTPTFDCYSVKVTTDAAAYAGRQVSCGNKIYSSDQAGLGVAIDSGNRGNMVLLQATVADNIAPTIDLKTQVFDNDGDNIVRLETRALEEIPTYFDPAATNYIYDSNPAIPTATSIQAGSTLNKPVGNLFNPAVSHVASLNKVCYAELITRTTDSNKITGYTTSSAVPASTTLYVQMVFRCPPQVSCWFQIYDAVNTDYYDFVTQTWVKSSWVNKTIPCSGLLEYINTPIVVDGVATRKLQLQVITQIGYGVDAARTVRLYYYGITDLIGAGLIHKRGGNVVGYGMDIARFTTATLPAAAEVPIGTVVFDTTSNTRKTSNGSSWV